MIEENVSEAMRYIKESRMRLDTLESRLKDFANISALQDALGEPLTANQKAVHLTRFSSERTDFEASRAKFDTIVDATETMVTQSDGNIGVPEIDGP